MNQGAVLMDNTTVFGARSAWESWPVQVDDWFKGPLAVNVRSLMDVLEAIVLHDRILLDASSRNFGAWPTLDELRDEHGEPVLEEDEIAAHDPALTSVLVLSALERLHRAVAAGVLEANFRGHAENAESLLPDFYATPRRFAQLTLESFGGDLSDEAVAALTQTEHELERLPAMTSSLATFIFRGFYYEHLAHLHSVSYVPHSWRALFLDESISPQIDFARYVVHAAQDMRSELAETLNSEFGQTIFTAEFPVIASYVAAHTASRSELFQTALQIRESESARRFRAWTYEIESSLRDQRGLAVVDRARRELSATVKALTHELGVSPGRRPTQAIKIKVGLPVASAETDVSVHAPRWVRRILHRRTHLTFLRQLAIESMTIAPFAFTYHKLTP